MITLRELRLSDAPFMLEWMQDADIQKSFRKDMRRTTLQQAEKFCKTAASIKEPVQGESLHWAIVESTEDEYLGTISLKNIDLESKTAEYAISMRRKAHGKGIGTAATRLILQKAFFEYDLRRVYLNVLSDNEKAIRLYLRCGFVYEGESREHLVLQGKPVSLKWFGMLKRECPSEFFAFGEGE